MAFNKLTKLIKDLPSDGEWFHKVDYNTFIGIGDKLLYKFKLEEVIEMLTDLYNAEANEYGE